MVKGVSKRAIVVRTPDPRLFEEAIFIVREEAFSAQGVSAEQVLQEARSAARGYMERNVPLRRLRRIPMPVSLALGALIATLCWAAALWAV
ncbi:translation initiation factor 2 [Pseudoflavonifractor sp. MSJ-37]|uniref:translation initiation factor 2 n=1 Tax=Pseudoflavonifractor sp. MSJ-37 TaxID=2841531 RepID=UPI001C105779|nr:translation initiation factor 2 [Pseudoflavonifractor sp. MSJ-37]MBU5434015.1 translation initiation factor 2 [Pseudoflavonifractor sp. MSJ-37]